LRNLFLWIHAILEDCLQTGDGARSSSETLVTTYQAGDEARSSSETLVTAYQTGDGAGNSSETLFTAYQTGDVSGSSSETLTPTRLFCVMIQMTTAKIFGLLYN
jgi:hypothetical protein